ncbi:hypothetical protein B0H17DRAFT_914576, partial [Mycena rosella]
DSHDHSCAYDATFTILTNIWAEDTIPWSGRFDSLSPMMGQYGAYLRSVIENRWTLEQARDRIRRHVHAVNPTHFPYGPNQTSIDRLAVALFPSKSYAKGRQSCALCGFADATEYRLLEATLSAGLNTRADYPVPVRIQDWFGAYLTKGRTSCTSCRRQNIRRKMTMLRSISDVPPIILLEITHNRLRFDQEIGFDCDGTLIRLRLRGIVYGGQGHFNARFIDRSGVVWFHDGITTGKRCVRETEMRLIADTMSLQMCGTKGAVAVVYARVI